MALAVFPQPSLVRDTLSQAVPRGPVAHPGPRDGERFESLPVAGRQRGFLCSRQRVRTENCRGGAAPASEGQSAERTGPTPS